MRGLKKAATCSFLAGWPTRILLPRTELHCRHAPRTLLLTRIRSGRMDLGFTWSAVSDLMVQPGNRSQQTGSSARDSLSECPPGSEAVEPGFVGDAFAHAAAFLAGVPGRGGQWKNPAPPRRAGASFTRGLGYYG